MRSAKRRAIIFTVLALMFAITAGILFLQQVHEVDAQLGEKVTVYVAKKSIPSRQPLNVEDFEAKEVPHKFLAAGAVGDLKDIDQFVSVVPLSKGEQLNVNILKPATELTSGENRMVTITGSDRILFDGAFEANDRVDILVSRKKGEEAEQTETVLFMKDVLVLGVSKEEEGISSIGVEVSLEDAKKLVHEINFAHTIRLLKAPQGHSEDEKKAEEETEQADEADQKQDEKDGKKEKKDTKDK